MPKYLVGATKRKVKTSSNFSKGCKIDVKLESNTTCKIKESYDSYEIKHNHQPSKKKYNTLEHNHSIVSCSIQPIICFPNNPDGIDLENNDSNENLMAEDQKKEMVSEIMKKAQVDNDKLDDNMKPKGSKYKQRPKGPSLKVFRCHVCKYKCKTWNGLKKHCKDHHNTLPQITCTCGNLLFTRTSVIEHRIKHLGRNIFRCDKCEKTFYRKSLLNLHVLSHLPKDQQPYVCSKCARHFHSESLLRNHERVHLPKEQKLIHPCHLCRKMFSSSSAVSAHLKAVHLGERPFICDQCGNTFTSKGILQEHLTTHSELTPWSCSECSKSFKTKYRLKIHMDIHTASSYQCPKCPIQLSTKRTLRMHLVVHGDLKAYQCSYCGKAFKRAKDLKNHNNLHTGQKPYTCPFCLRTFANGSNCRSHKRRMHPEELQAYEESLQAESISSKPSVGSPTLSTFVSAFNETSSNDLERGKTGHSLSEKMPSSDNKSLNHYKVDNDLFNRTLVKTHSVFKDTLCISGSENPIYNIPAFPGNPYLHHKPQQYLV